MLAFEYEVAEMGAPEAPPIAVFWIVMSAVEEAAIGYRRMVMVDGANVASVGVLLA